MNPDELKGVEPLRSYRLFPITLVIPLWAAAHQSLNTARSDLDTAQNELEGPKSELDARFEAEFEERKEELEALESRAFGRNELPSWGDDSGLAGTSSWRLSGIDDDRLSRFGNRVRKLRYQRKEALAKIPDDVDDRIRERIARELRLLEDLDLLLSELSATNERLESLENAMKEERTQMAEQQQ